MSLFKRGTVATIVLTDVTDHVSLFSTDIFLGFFKTATVKSQHSLNAETEPSALQQFKQDALCCLSTYGKSVKSKFTDDSVEKHLAKVGDFSKKLQTTNSIIEISKMLDSFLTEESFEGYQVEICFNEAVIIPTT